MELYLVEYHRKGLFESECDEQFVISVCSSLKKALEFKKEFLNQWGEGVIVRKIQLNKLVDAHSQVIYPAHKMEGK